jgi:tRNA pseudouridine38-40 synthase
MRVALKFAYDGRQFSGFARQPGRRTVESNLLMLLQDWGAVQSPEQSRFRSGSRTDRGVSARGNVVAFSTEMSLDTLLDHMPGVVPDIFVYGAQVVEESFYPRFAEQRHYRYYLRVEGLDCSAVLQVVPVFRGQHDFRNFAKLEPGKDPIRCIDRLEYAEEGRFLVLDFWAQAFLWHQVRRIVAAMIRVGLGKISADDVVRALDDPLRRVDYGLAAAEPLILQEVVYPFTFQELSDARVAIEKLERLILSRL